MRRLCFVFVGWALLVLGCSGQATSALTASCTPGTTQACSCAGHKQHGEQVCGTAGAFLPCTCAAASGGRDAGNGSGADGGGCVADDAKACSGKCGELTNACGNVIECGGCVAGQTCGGGGKANVCAAGTCVPSCAGKACGDGNGCDGVCSEGSCASGRHCVAGACACDPASCPGCCSGSVCEPGTASDACGAGGAACAVCGTGTKCGTTCGVCGGTGQACCAGDTCSAPLTCNGGTCSCTPSCAGVPCGGSDGCGGTCGAGSCPEGQTCVAGACACNPTSCPSGCCSGVACELGTEASACGAGGEACVACSAENGGPTCTAGRCTSAACESPSMMCGSACCSVSGDPTSLGGVGTYDTGNLCVRPVTIGPGGHLVDIGILGITAGVEVVMGLYSDVGGVPDQLLAQTGEASLVNGPLLLPTTVTPVAAASYWIAAEFNGTAQVVESPATTVTAYCASAGFTQDLPALFPSSAPYSGRQANWYVLIE